VPRFLIAGRISPSKGVFEAADAFARMKAGIVPGAELHVVGSGEALEDLTAHVRRLGVERATTFHGWIPAGEGLFSLYREMDVLLHLSVAESLPRLIWDALANSVLVICTPVGGIPDVFRNGREVVFVEPGEPRGVDDAVSMLLADRGLRSRLIERGYELAREATVERIVDDLVERAAVRWPELRGDSKIEATGDNRR
jgi:glycosyltransferase involved in cell wall biosynthesis